jgi:3-hydroxyacyl-CoA dehydrogenase/enoyl-CoA hydratase/3-hydroxybutyryl-CoA epimerase/enoyl-CoA isomerase
MKFEGKSFQCSMLEGGVAELRFDLKGESVNKFNAPTLAELTEVVDLLEADPGVKGLILVSGKELFVVGADITEFLQLFRMPTPELIAWCMRVHKLFSKFEDLPFPTVTALNGVCVGGGMELSISSCCRVMASNCKIGFPEVGLGILPAWGGTVRFSRLVGPEHAADWIINAGMHKAAEALELGVVDAVVAPEDLREAALGLLKQCMEGRIDWKARQQEKREPIKLNATERKYAFERSKALAFKGMPNYPAAMVAMEEMEAGSTKGRDEALAIEAEAFATRLAVSATAKALVTNFLAKDAVAKAAKKIAKTAVPVKSAAVLGAGIMGGGIAHQSASTGTRIIMKDIDDKALELGLAEASKLLSKPVEKGKMTPAAMAAVLARIKPTLSYGDFRTVDLVVEAVSENEKLKKIVLAEVEGQVKDDAVLTTNTSSISITRLATALKRPENFCGMHFFNPVNRMPLVEVIRGPRTGDAAVAATVAYALAMGKAPIVVNDCPGFLVNRLLIPYLLGFCKLVNHGVDYRRIDKVMEDFGWPMGPAYLLDVVGNDTAIHAIEVLDEGFPDRMGHPQCAVETMFDLKRLGQKNGKGFYAYVPDRRGIPRKTVDPDTEGILKAALIEDISASVTDQDIIDRMMLPMITEASRCLEDKIVATPAEVDQGLLNGLGFPPFRGGALYYAGAQGLRALCQRAETFRSLGKLYEPTPQMLRLAEAGLTFYEEK